MLQKIVDIGKQLLVDSNVHNMLTTALDGAIEITGAERGMIILFEEKREILFEAARNLQKTDIQNPKFEISRTIIERVKKTGESLCLKNALEDPTLKRSSSALRLKILSVICLPLCKTGQNFGVVYLDNRTVEGAFEPEIFDFATSFVDFISLAAYQALERKRLSDKVEALEAELRSKYHFDAIIGHHPKVVEVLKLVAQIAPTDATVLIQGESGTGKELLAKALHFNSNRKQERFVPINCGALPENLLESELFGHIKGAFTGAIKEKDGWFASANGGTLFFDEVSEMPPSLQVKLLRVLQTGEFSPVGSNEICYSDVRVIAATNQELKGLVEKKKFREDLYYRLNVVDLELPPLRERRGDIPLLAQHFLSVFNSNSENSTKLLSSEAETLLLSYDYPGNIRELENAIQRAWAVSDSQLIDSHHLPESMSRIDITSSVSKTPSTLTSVKRQAAEKAEHEMAAECLRASHGHISKAAIIAGVHVGNFHKIMKKYGLDARDFK